MSVRRRTSRLIALGLVAGALAVSAQPAQAADLTEGFDNISNLAGWQMRNLSPSIGINPTWAQGDTSVFPAQSGAANSYLYANFQNTTGTNTISNWLISPPQTTFTSTDELTFWTRTATPNPTTYPDRLEVRLSTNGSCNPGTTPTSVGDFTRLLTTVNPTLTTSGYPFTWTKYTVSFADHVTGRDIASGCFAFRYFVTGGGPSGSNSDYIGLDSVTYTDNPQPPDVTPPVVTIGSGPSGKTTETTPTFAFSADEEATFECRVSADDEMPADFDACSGPDGTHTVLNPLQDGDYTFEVRATDLADNSATESRTFQVTAAACTTATAAVDDAELAVTAAQSAVESAQNDTTLAEDAAGGAQSDLEDAQDAATAAANAVANAEAAAAAAASDAADLTDAATSASEAKTDADAALASARAERDKAQAALADARTALATSQSSATQAQSSLAQTESALAEARAAVATAQTTRKRAAARKAAMATKVADARKSLAKAKRGTSSDELTKAQAKVKALVKKNQAAKKTLMAARADLRAAWATAKTAEATYVSAQAGHANGESGRTAAEQKVAAAQAAANTTAAAVATAETDQADAAAVLTAAQEALTAGEAVLTEAQETLAEAVAAQAAADDALTAAESALTDAVEDLATAQAALVEAEDTLSAAQQDLTEAQDAVTGSCV